MSNLHTWGHVRHGSFITNSLQSLQALKSWPKLSPDVMEPSSTSSTIWQTLNCWINNLITVRCPWGKLGELVKLALRSLQNRLEIAVWILRLFWNKALKAFGDEGNSWVQSKIDSYNCQAQWAKARKKVNLCRSKTKINEGLWRGPGVKNKFQKNIDFSLWGNRATTQCVFGWLHNYIPQRLKSTCFEIFSSLLTKYFFPTILLIVHYRTFCIKSEMQNFKCYCRQKKSFHLEILQEILQRYWDSEY